MHKYVVSAKQLRIKKDLIKYLPTLTQGGSTLSNKEARFKEKREEVPGPGYYAIENKEKKSLIVVDTRVCSLINRH